MTDPSKAAKGEILKRYDAIVRGWNNAAAQITLLQKQRQDLVQQGDDCNAAARLFGFDLQTEYQVWAAGLSESTEAAAVEQTSKPMPVLSSGSGKSQTVKDVILTFAKEAYPEHVTAKRLREMLGRQGYNLHEKTVGMTLYRLATKGFIRREGKAAWFYVPEDRRRAALGEESPGDQPGLDLAAE